MTVDKYIFVIAMFNLVCGVHDLYSEQNNNIIVCGAMHS